GYRDRITRDKLKMLRGASCEESVLGMMLLYPEYIKSSLDGDDGAPQREDFMTQFGQRVFDAITGIYRENGSFDFGALSAEFSLDEVSRLTKLMQSRSGLDNSPAVFKGTVAALRTEGEREKEKKLDAFDAIMRRRKKNTDEGQ
ncbi:MAG: hypothetical protein LUH54_02415, partial [Firmicutes bacterium]|nr:hypothetical protein [Bacillota bacterium]